MEQRLLTDVADIQYDHDVAPASKRRRGVYPVVETKHGELDAGRANEVGELADEQKL